MTGRGPEPTYDCYVKQRPWGWEGAGAAQGVGGGTSGPRSGRAGARVAAGGRGSEAVKRSIVVVCAGLRRPSATRLLADRLGEATVRRLAELGSDTRVTTVELRDHGHDLLDRMTDGYPSEELAAVLEAVARADGLITVTPTFNASYSGLFKLFLDALEGPALADKPVLIAATGGTGRHFLVLEHAMRPVFSHFQAVVVPTGVFAAPEDWVGGSRLATPLVRRVERAAGELAREVASREAPMVDDPLELPKSFTELLKGG